MESPRIRRRLEPRRLLIEVAFLLSLVITGGVGVLDTTTNRATQERVVAIETIERREQENLQMIDREVGRLEVREQHEVEHRGLAGPCICVDESPPGRDFEAVSCSLAAECDEKAIRDCEKEYPTF